VLPEINDLIETGLIKQFNANAELILASELTLRPATNFGRRAPATWEGVGQWRTQGCTGCLSTPID